MNLRFVLPKITSWFLPITLLLYICAPSHSQNIDSLCKRIQDKTIDTSTLRKSIITLQKDSHIGLIKTDSLVSIIFNLSKEKEYKKGIALVYRYKGLSSHIKGDFKDAISNHRKSLEIFNELNDSTFIVYEVQALSSSYFNLGSQDSAIFFCSKVIKYFKYRNDLKNLASSYNTLGGIYWAKGEFSKAADGLFESLKIKEQLKDSLGIANTYNNIGILYDSQQKLTEALEMYYKSLDLFQKKKSKRGISKATNNIAIVLKNLNRCGEAIEMLLRSLEIDKELGNKNEQGKTLNNIGQLYLQINDPNKAIYYLKSAITIFDQSDDINSEIAANINLGRAYIILGEYNKAYGFLSKSLEAAKQNNSIEWIKESYYYLYQLHKKTGNITESLYNFEKYSNLNDSLRNLEGINRIDELKVKFETEKKEKEILLLNKENDLKNLEIERQKSINHLFILIILLAVLFVVLISYVLFRIRNVNRALLYKNSEINQQKEEIESQFDQVESLNIELSQQKEEILSQRDEIELKNKIISATNLRLTENIEYASRIQEALLPNLDLIKGFFVDQSIIYKPKDIVSGDFYWMWAHEDRICFSIADCTGHGVSGAFMSILAYNFLKDSIITHGLSSPSDIVSFINDEVENNLYSNLTHQDVKDGMDLLVCFYYPNRKLLEFSGAHGSFMHLRNGFVTNYKTDRYSIGSRIKQGISFTNNQIVLEKGDRLFLFTDGYIDQLEAVKRKKIGRNAFANLIETTSGFDLTTQMDEVETFLNTWMGASDQIDDILIWGLEV